jgi:plasmid segregation protein ParM
MAKRGIDGGNCSTKTSTFNFFHSKVSKTPNILKDDTYIKINGETLYIGEGTYDTEYRKVKKQYYKEMVIYATAISSKDTSNQIVIGSPIGQFKQDKDTLKQMFLKNPTYYIEVNGTQRTICLEAVEVFPEGVVATVGTSFSGVVLDIGGRTTDCAYVEDNDGLKKVRNPISYPKGTLNLYSDFIKAINSKYVGLELEMEDAHRILTEGLYIDGWPIDISEAIEIPKAFVENLVSDIRLEYKLRTDKVLLVGGGCQLLAKAIQNRIPAAQCIDNFLFANAVGLGKVADELWQ